MPVIPKSTHVVVSSAGTAVQLVTESEIIQAGQEVHFAADINAGAVFLGNSGVSSANGFEVDANHDAFIIKSHAAWDISELWVDASVNNAHAQLFWFGEEQP